jgi:pimeloyl-ACP methyl ester carboxylesterase
MKLLAVVVFTFFSINVFAIKIPQGFKQEKVRVGDITLNVYKGGQGDPVLLLHGYAQSALMWAPLMKQLKNKFTVIVPDIRGAGFSDAPESGYDKVTMAEDIVKLLEHYHISKARVVGHDIGLMVSYALAARYPDFVEKLVVMDAFIPGVGPGDSVYNSPDIWHFRFHGPYAEKLVKGREYIFLDSLWTGFSARPHSFPEDQKRYYVSQYARPGRMKAGFAYFENMPKDARDNREFVKTKLSMPVLSIGGEKSLGQALSDTMKIAAESLEEKIVMGCGHWMLEECPKETIQTVENFLIMENPKQLGRR